MTTGFNPFSSNYTQVPPPSYPTAASRTRPLSNGIPPQTLSCAVVNSMNGNNGQLNDEALFDAQYHAANVLNTGSQEKLTPEELSEVHADIQDALRNSASDLGDTYTAAAIEDTLTDALAGSLTFKLAVSYGLEAQCVPLKDIVFAHQNPFASSSDKPTMFPDAGSDDLSTTRLQHPEPGSPLENEDVLWDTIYVAAAPPVHSRAMDAWKAELVHQVMRVVTGASDPQASPESHGGAKILAKAVAIEMGWKVPEHMQSWDNPGNQIASW